MAPKVGHIFKPIRDRIADMSIWEPNSGCLIWLGADNGNGYGRVGIGRRMFYAHRISYELSKGPIPETLQLDHICRNTFCINPDHLEPVTNRENTTRGKVSKLRPARPECSRGHPLQTTGYVDTQGHTQCRACHSQRMKAYYSRKKANVQR